MDLDSLLLTIITVAREPAYIHQTLASMFMADPLVHDLSAVHLVVDSNKSFYLDNYGQHM